MNHPDPTHPDTAPSPPAMPSDRGSWPIGLAFAIGCIVMVIPLAFFVGKIAEQFGLRGEAQLGLALTLVVLFGLSQWLFVVPLGLCLRYRGKTDTAMGLWISAGVATLLNGACFGLMQVF